MSNFGFNLINEKGYSLIDETFSNFIFKCSGTIHNTNMVSYDRFTKYCLLDITELNFPLIFFRPITNTSRITTFSSLGYMGISGPRSKKYVQINAWWNLALSDVEYFVYDIYTPQNRSRYGLQVFNEQSEIIFDSSWQFLKLYGVHWLDPGFPNVKNGESDWTSIGTFHPGRKIAVAVPYARQMVIDLTMGGQWVMSDSYWINPTTNEIRISMIPRGECLWSGSWTGYLQHKMKTQIMIANIEGLPSNYNPLKITH